jgi:isoleucyl-tRNA synthetase
VGSSNEVEIIYKGFEQLGLNHYELAEVFIVSSVIDAAMRPTLAAVASLDVTDLKDAFITVTKTAHHKCGRCWRHLPEVSEDDALCNRCEAVVNG